jgi:hypothetical protein
LRQNPVIKGYVEKPGDYKWMRIGGQTWLGSDPYKLDIIAIWKKL